MQKIDLRDLKLCLSLLDSKALSTLSQKSATVAENGETTAKFGDCRTFLRQCGQGFKSTQDKILKIMISSFFDSVVSHSTYASQTHRAQFAVSSV